MVDCGVVTVLREVKGSACLRGRSVKRGYVTATVIAVFAHVIRQALRLVKKCFSVAFVRRRSSRSPCAFVRRSELTLQLYA